MASLLSFRVFPYFPKISGYKTGFRGRISCNSGDKEPTISRSDRDSVEDTSGGNENVKLGSAVARNSRQLGSIVESKRTEEVPPVRLKVLWDDGFGSKSAKDYLSFARLITKPDGGPPRWFCPVECGWPLEGSPVLLYLPGIDGFGVGLIMHHTTLGKVFEVRCLHIPLDDRTPFEGLLEFVEQAVREEHTASPNKPIYLVGDSFGGCLALAVAARNPTIDLVLILVNPATSLDRSQIKFLFPILEALPDQLHTIFPYLLSFIMGEPLKMAKVLFGSNHPPSQMLKRCSQNLIAAAPNFSLLSDIIADDTVRWKVKLLKSADAYSNSCLHAVKAEVLLLASAKDRMLPSKDEAKRLSSLLRNCELRIFKDSGHILLGEQAINLLSVIKGTGKYRRSKRWDIVTDFVPPSKSEWQAGYNKYIRFLQYYTSPVMFSTLADGTIVRGLDGVPSDGPVLLVGFHMLIGLELVCLIEGFLREKNIMVRGLAHPELFVKRFSEDFRFFDDIRLFGGTPVSANNFYKLLAEKSHLLLYPGGAREALRKKGELYKLFWPDRPEFVRMAAKFGATIVPFGVVGEDDISKLVFDYDDYMRTPLLRDILKASVHGMTKVRTGTEGEVGNQNIHIPGVIPKLSGRFYYLFGRPIETRGKPELMQDKKSAEEVYMQIKSDIESNIAFLLAKRNEDPYRGFIDRITYYLSNPNPDVPTFSP